MPSSTRSERFVRAYALLRGAMFVVYAVSLILAPEKVIAGSSGEPARAIGLMFASRTLLLGMAFVVLAIRGKREGLAWVLLADSALQLFDTGMALVLGKYAVVILPAALAAVDAWAGLVLLRAARVSPVVARQQSSLRGERAGDP